MGEKLGCLRLLQGFLGEGEGHSPLTGQGEEAIDSMDNPGMIMTRGSPRRIGACDEGMPHLLRSPAPSPPKRSHQKKRSQEEEGTRTQQKQQANRHRLPKFYIHTDTTATNNRQLPPCANG